MAKLRVQAWWLEPGTEICPSCDHFYLYETEYRCSDCDGPMCSDCVPERDTLTVVCGTCVACGEQELEPKEVEVS